MGRTPGQFLNIRLGIISFPHLEYLHMTLRASKMDDDLGTWEFRRKYLATGEK